MAITIVISAYRKEVLSCGAVRRGLRGTVSFQPRDGLEKDGSSILCGDSTVAGVSIRSLRRDIEQIAGGNQQ